MTMIVFSRRFSLSLTTLLLVFVLATGAAAQSFMATHAKVSLVAESNSLPAGQTAWVGVLFDLEKGWHIYWVNPGDSGEPPKIQWHLPAGFQAGEIRWPMPVRLRAGTVIDYGYEGQVLLPVSLRVPAGYRSANPVTLSADVRYLICREVCIPAAALAKLSIPSANAGDAADRVLFRSAFDSAPKTWPAGWKAQASENGGFFLLSLETGASESKASFFPLEADQIDNDAMPGVTPTPRGVQIKLKRSDQLLKPIAALKGVVVLGAGRAFEVSAPLAGKK
jgi:DsbC/DsbD-like thiol-disulfide interchange protein